jgi:hypothetical protein
MDVFINGISYTLPENANEMTQKQLREAIGVEEGESLSIYQIGRDDVGVRHIDAPISDAYNCPFRIEAGMNLYTEVEEILLPKTVAVA